MKKRVLLLFIGVISFLSVWSQNDSLQFKSIFVGVRNNKYASIGFQAKNWSVGLENTIFIRHLSEQYIRANGTFRYSTGVWGVKFSAEAFFGTNYAGRFYDSGLKIGLDKKIGRVEFGAGVMPMYDSGMGYNTCYTVHAACRVIQEAALVLDITNIPEYRMVEHRIVPGILFRAHKLWVRPELSIPLNDNVQFTRVLISFRYDFFIEIMLQFDIDVKTGIRLREVTLNDAPMIYRAIADHRDYLKTWLPFVINLSEQDEMDFLSQVLSFPEEERNFTFVIECRGEFCGLVGFVNSDFVNHRTEIGYWLLPEYQRQGIMTRSVRTLCRWAVEARLMHRIQIRCAVENYSSNAIPRRLGFRLEGTERDGELMFSGEYVDTNVYSILDSEIISWSGKNI